MNMNDIVSFGPRLIGTDILFIKSKTNKFMLKYCSLFHKLYKINNNENQNEFKQDENNNLYNLISQAIQNGFQSVTLRGPLCGEPMYGVGFIIDNIQIISTNNSNENNNENNVTDNRFITTNIMTNMRDGCINSFLSLSPRLGLPMYKVFIQRTTEVLGSIYDVIQKRKGKISGVIQLLKAQIYLIFIHYCCETIIWIL